jgi:hypothetical protein
MLNMKTCTHCKQEKPFEAFYTSSTHKSGYVSWCKVCESERCKAKFERRKERHLAKAKEWREENPDANKASVQAWRESNPERTAAMYRDWAERNRDKVNAKWMARDAAKKSRTPSWLTVDDHWIIEQAYDIAAKRTQVLGIQFHVDHIVPLQGRTVSGLHVPWNLQVIPAKLNQQKSNRFN